MNVKKRGVLIAAIILAAVLLNSLPIRAFGGGTDYIVKYRASAVPTDGQARFAVVSERELRRLKRADALEWYEPDGEAVLLGPAAPYYDEAQWNLELIGAETAFRRDCLGQGVRVGVLDSGVNPHPDLGERLLPGHNYIPDAADPDDTSDAYGHGTRIAGLVAAAAENGYIGTAPGAEIVPLKVTDGKTVKVSAICEAIYAAIDTYGCNVLNLSMGVQTDYEALREAVAYAEEKNVVVVSAVGNNGSSAVYYPAGYDTVIGVGGVDSGGNVSHSSQHNASVFLTAPGVKVRSIAASGGYISSSGTSFATPQAAGAAAVLLGMDGSLTPDAIRTILAQTAVDRGAEGYDEYYGHGLLNLSGCVELLADRQVQAGNSCSRDETCALRAFSDLDPAAWYHDGVHYALERGIMNGCGDGLFQPDGAASRAMLVTILWRLEGAPAADDAYRIFSDVDDAAWYAGAVRWAYAERIVNGYRDDVFAPDDPVTREQFAAVLYRYLQRKGDGFDGAWSFQPDFSDLGEVSDWAYEPVCWMTMRGILQGTGKGLLSPKGTATRAQTATMLMRCAQP